MLFMNTVYAGCWMIFWLFFAYYNYFRRRYIYAFSYLSVPLTCTFFFDWVLIFEAFWANLRVDNV